ncbi:Glycosyltransferase, catalytic subunit of cellulose synthase and poly-beta-1,6-N-acetylglucosamine synthase [Alkalicoccus daliensis]|uniref:Glycosyltransferase, catalytic subunit of cellulose synthase and poly-beta-1,6-N-acetylglucosamine synthase n=1 Tax=Alkalicoccus daliensis TaxID=745820 RepID=A0A1H0HWZ3_9BACI|nr:Glycosyltransferase, catalytic subunit of cellulose synthase and poly-beta-1,6-N-acetylglucosamine synthase [Alkalicoccus daliensis]
MAELLLYTSLFLIWFMLFYHMFLMQGGYLHFLKHPETKRKWDLEPGELPTFSILIPAHNEEVVIEKTLQAMTELDYPKEKLEVILINDNSSDATGKIGEEFAREFPFIKVLHTKPPHAGKGKSGALNQGFKVSSGEIIAVYDADNLPEPEAAYNLALGLNKDEKAGAVVGKFRVLNARKNILTRMINVETLTFQWLAQAGRWFWFKMCTIPGTNFAIRRSILEELGGWDEKALSEDTELSFRVYNLGYYIRFFPEAVTWEQEPENLKVWWKQRTRWARGNEYVIAKYLIGFFKLKNKKIGLDLAYFLFTYLLFFGGILISHAIFVTNIFVDLNLTIGTVSYVLLITGFLLFVTEVLLALSMEKGQLTMKNAAVVVLMYFTYSQLWVILVMYATFLEAKRMIFRQEVKWYKTQRFQQNKPEENITGPVLVPDPPSSEPDTKPRPVLVTRKKKMKERKIK